jgi:transposase
MKGAWGCPALQRLSHNSIIKQLFDTFICFQLHINIMAFIRRLRNQNWLFPPTIADLIEKDHICRLVDAVVKSIDFKSIEGRYDGPGSPAYHPKVMMKLLIQGTIDGIRSLIKIISNTMSKRMILPAQKEKQ